jgi:hypothetical protein
MRMLHYYLALALVLAPCLLLTLQSGALQDGSERHLALGLFTAVLCVATNTLLILFMIVSGRVLKAAMLARALSSEFLTELNQFFAQRRAYPLAILAAFAATAAAVLGYGRFIGVPSAVHVLVGLAAIVLNVLALVQGGRILRANQALLDRAAAELDRLDAAGAPVRAGAGEPQWAYSSRTRWLVFAASAWAPYLYWSLVVWRGAFERVSPLFLVLSALVSLFGLAQAVRASPAPD